MTVENENAGSSQGHVEESQTQSSEQTQDSGDGWDSAREVFEDADEGVEESQATDENSSHLEADESVEKEESQETEQLDEQKKDVNPLDALPVPHKYKQKVKEFVEKQTQELSQRFQKAEETTKTATEANSIVVNVLKEIARDPSKLVDIVSEYGETFGVDSNVVNEYRRMKYSGGSNQQRESSNQETGTVDAIFDKYVEKMISTEDPKEFASTLKAVINETQNVSKNELIDVVKGLLGGYHDKIVKPNLSEIEKQKQVAAENARHSVWTKAEQKVIEKMGGNEVFKPYVKDMLGKLSSDPRVIILNENPELARKSGITHEKLIEEAFYLVTRGKDLSIHKKEWKGGMKPTPKFVGTKKQAVSDWDAIKREIYGDD